jgi:hypothetical protein
MQKAAVLRKPPQASEGNGALSDFTQAIGSSKGFDPIPPDQYLTYQDRRYSPSQRLWAWMLAHTIALGHRSPWAVDRKTKKLLQIDDAARDLGMDPGDARRAWRELAAEGRVRKDGAKLVLAGDFALPPNTSAQKKVCTDLFLPYYQRQIAKLPPHLRESLIAEETEARAKSRIILADLTATVRFIFDQDQNTRFAQYGIKVIRETHKLPEAKAAELEARKKRMESLFPVVEKHVQTFLGKVCTNPETALYRLFPEGSETGPKPMSGKDVSERHETCFSEHSEKGELTSVVDTSKNGSPHPAIDPQKKNACLPVEAEKTQAGRQASSLQKAEEIRIMLVRLLGSKLPNTVPGRGLCYDILALLGSATLADLEQRILVRYESIQSYGVIADLARDVALLAATPQASTQPAINQPASKAAEFAEQYRAKQQRKSASGL